MDHSRTEAIHLSSSQLVLKRLVLGTTQKTARMGSVLNVDRSLASNAEDGKGLNGSQNPSRRSRESRRWSRSFGLAARWDRPCTRLTALEKQKKRHRSRHLRSVWRPASNRASSQSHRLALRFPASRRMVA